MEDLQGRGLIRHWGVSNFDVYDMEELIASGGTGCAADQIYLSLGERGACHSLLPWLDRHDMLTMAYSPVGQGDLATDSDLAALAAPLGLTAAQLALAWVTRQPRTIAIPKSVREQHLRDNLAASGVTLTADVLSALDQRFPPPRRKSPLAMT